jgi:hypothetical protein
MSQNDFSLANANGATFRADVNSAFQAIASSSSGSSAPGTTYGCQWWFDTTNDILKIRDEANANWVNVASLVGTTWIPYSNGSVLGTMANQNATAINVNLAMSAKSVAFATTSVTSGTPDFATAGNVVTLSSTATANTLGTVQAGFIGVIHYGIAITVTHNGTSRILPTGANIATAAGDVEIVVSLGSGNWRTVSYMRADGTAVGAGSATQAQQEGAALTSVFTSPGRQHFHPSAAKVWVKSIVTAGVPASPGDASYNITSVADTGVGRATFTIATDFSSANWACLITPEEKGDLGENIIAIAATTQAAGSVELNFQSESGAFNDPSAWHMVGFGDFT